MLKIRPCRETRERERERQRERQEKGEMTVTRMNSTTAKNTPAAMSLIRFRYMEFFRFLAYQERESCHSSLERRHQPFFET
jgi:hypothetical protein